MSKRTLFIAAACAALVWIIAKSRAGAPSTTDTSGGADRNTRSGDAGSAQPDIRPADVAPDANAAPGNPSWDQLDEQSADNPDWLA